MRHLVSEQPGCCAARAPPRPVGKEVCAARSKGCSKGPGQGRQQQPWPWAGPACAQAWPCVAGSARRSRRLCGVHKEFEQQVLAGQRQLGVHTPGPRRLSPDAAPQQPGCVWRQRGVSPGVTAVCV